MVVFRKKLQGHTEFERVQKKKKGVTDQNFVLKNRDGFQAAEDEFLNQ